MIHPGRFAGKVTVVTGAAQGIGRDRGAQSGPRRRPAGRSWTAPSSFTRSATRLPRPAARRSPSPPTWRHTPAQRGDGDGARARSAASTS